MSSTPFIVNHNVTRLPLFTCFCLWLLCAYDPFFNWISRMSFFTVISLKRFIWSNRLGFVAQGESGLVCKLRHSLYGLKQSPRAWFSRFRLVVQEFGMIRSTTDHSVFCHHIFTGQCIYSIVYVDDIASTGNDQDDIQKLKQHLFIYFQTKDLGKTHVFSRH